MAIEVRQMLVKSTVLQGSGVTGDTREAEGGQDVEALKDELLAACRRLVLEMLEKQRER